MWTNSIVYTFWAIFFVYFNTSKSKNCYKFCLAGSGSAFFKLLDMDPHWEEQVDPDPQEMNADSQPWIIIVVVYQGEEEVPYWHSGAQLSQEGHGGGDLHEGKEPSTLHKLSVVQSVRGSVRRKTSCLLLFPLKLNLPLKRQKREKNAQ